MKTILADIKPDMAGEGDVFTRMQDATMNELGSRTMSQETRDIFHSIRDYIAAAAKELADRESTATANQIEFHNAWIEDEATPANKKAEYKAALKVLEKRSAMDAAALLNDQELPALATDAWQEVRSRR